MAMAAGGVAGAGAARGPLRVCRENPRYFADPSGKPVYLAGAHTWPNLRDLGPGEPPPPFDFPRYLAFLEAHGHNFIRLWAWDLSRWEAPGDNAPAGLMSTWPLPWRRTGPGLALDGKPKFDLSQFEEEHFRRLRERVAAGGERGIYVSVMLFEGWGAQFCALPWGWEGHPFHPKNNINGVDGDPDRDGRGLEVYTLAVPAITRLQEAYLRKVVDTVNDLDNVLYEVCNEAGPYSTEWQYHVIEFVRAYERGKAKQHPIGMTFQYQGGSNQTLFDSPADWISPNPEAGEGYSYTENPPPAGGRKVILSDTDHLWGIGGNQAWVWKTFCRGMNPLFMDPYLHGNFYAGPLDQPEPVWDPIRKSLGYTRRLAERLDLARAIPSEELTSTRYCLAVAGKQYLVYLPEGGSVEVDLSAARGRLSGEWLNPSTGERGAVATVEGGGKRTFQAPFAGDAVLFLEAAG